MKTQTVRLLDVFLIGPVMIWAAVAPVVPRSVKLALLIFGVATIVYNGRNYLLNRTAQ